MSLMPLALSFISMFGVGGLFATRVLGLHGGAAAVVGAVAGAIGAGIAFVLFSALRRAEAEQPFSLSDLAGSDAIVSVAIRPRGWGSVLVHAEGQRHEISATSAQEIGAGMPVRITGAIGTGVSVEPLETAPSTAPASIPEPTTPPPETGASAGS
jgi:membrane-bound ClpP family serine protease